MFAQTIRELQKNGVDGIDTTVTFKNFPLSIHPTAPMAHQAALAAGEQGRFWEMHDLLFANQQRVQRSDLIDFARQLGLDQRRFVAALDSEQLRHTIEADVADGEARQITGTPTFFVNGQEYVGNKSFAQLKEVIESERRRATALAEITDDLLSRGPANAPVTIELFADLQSPVSSPAAAVLNDVMKRYPSQVRLQFRNFPLAFHPQAALAHEAAVTAARGGRFWEFVAYALDHQDGLREQDLIALAGRLGLDADAFAATMRSHRYAPRVQADVAAGARKGIRGSPVILVNGRRIDGVPGVNTLVEYVDTALETSKPVQ
jgi:protein-disulfide isomerase